MRTINEFLDSFQVNLAEKLALMEKLKDAFGREFGMNISLKQQLDKKYRANRPIIEGFLKKENAETLFFPLAEILEPKSQNSKPVIEQILETNQSVIGLHDFLASHIHILLNRLIPTNQRLHELLIYDFLFRQYKSLEMKKTENFIQSNLHQGEIGLELLNISK